jgi:hypothetical protein
MSTGSAPVTAPARYRTIGVKPSSSAISAVVTSKAAAPSEICEGGFERSQLLDTGTAPHPLVSGDDGAVRSLGSIDKDGNNLLNEGAAVLGRAGTLVRLGGVFVESAAGEPPLLGDHLGRQTLVEGEVVVAGQDLRTVRHPGGPGRTKRDAAHQLDAAGDDDILLARHHRVHGEVESLLAGTARPVDRGPGDALGPAGGQDGVAPDIAGLVTDLGNAAPDHVVDDRRVDTGAFQQFIEHDCGQVGWMYAGQPAVALPDRGPYRLDDDCLTHAPTPISRLL